MTEIFDPPLKAVGIDIWIVQYPDPVSVKAGETIILGQTDPEWPGWIWCTDPRGKSAWMPAAYIQPRPNGTGIALCDYSARELNIKPGDQVLLHKLESGWYWASIVCGEHGWIPASHVRLE